MDQCGVAVRSNNPNECDSTGVTFENTIKKEITAI